MSINNIYLCIFWVKSHKKKNIIRNCHLYFWSYFDINNRIMHCKFLFLLMINNELGQTWMGGWDLSSSFLTWMRSEVCGCTGATDPCTGVVDRPMPLWVCAFSWGDDRLLADTFHNNPHLNYCPTYVSKISILDK